MQTEHILYGLWGILAILVLIAAATDIKGRIISNKLNLCMAALAPIHWWAAGLGLWPEIAIQIGLAGAAFAILAVLFAMRAIGGGDVKLLAALALWFTPAAFVNLIVIMALTGGALALAFGAWHIMRRRKDRLSIPYGIAIAVGTIWIIARDHGDGFGKAFGIW